MNTLNLINANAEMTHLLAAFDRFDGSCDSDFDAGLEELERQFAELRLAFDHN